MNLFQTIKFSQKRKTQYRKSLQAGVSEHEALQAEAERRFVKIFNRVAAGKIDADEFKSQFQRSIETAYVNAFKSGKGTEKLTNKDRRWINTRIAEQYEYLESFADDIAAGSNLASAERAALYARGSQSAYWRGSVSDFDGAVDWILGANTNNCEDCIEMADGSPYEPGELRQVPGDGNTVCLGNCHCVLVETQ